MLTSYLRSSKGIPNSDAVLDACWSLDIDSYPDTPRSTFGQRGNGQYIILIWKRLLGKQLDQRETSHLNERLFFGTLPFLPFIHKRMLWLSMHMVGHSCLHNQGLFSARRMNGPIRCFCSRFSEHVCTVFNGCRVANNCLVLLNIY